MFAGSVDHGKAVDFYNVADIVCCPIAKRAAGPMACPLYFWKPMHVESRMAGEPAAPRNLFAMAKTGLLLTASTRPRLRTRFADRWRMGTADTPWVREAWKWHEAGGGKHVRSSFWKCVADKAGQQNYSSRGPVSFFSRWTSSFRLSLSASS